MLNGHRAGVVGNMTIKDWQTWRVGSVSETLRHRHQVDNQATIFNRMNIISELLMFNGHRAGVVGNMTIKDWRHGEWVHFQKHWDIGTKSTTRQPFLQDEHYMWTFNIQWPSSWCGGEYDHQRLATWRVGSFSETLRHHHQVDNQTTIFYRMNIISELLMFNGHWAGVVGNMTIKNWQHGELIHFQKHWDIVTKSTTRQPFFTGWKL